MHKVLAITLGFFALVYFAFQIFFIIPAAFDGSSPADFPNYYFAGKRLFEGRAIYKNLEQEVMSAMGWRYTVYPADTPFTITLLSPLSLLNYKAAWFLLAAISVSIVILSIYKVSSELNFKEPDTFLLVSLALSASCTIFLIKRNHMESLLLGAGIIGWLNLRRSHESLAGFYWGLAAALKLFPLIWLFGALLCGKFRLFIIGTLSFLFFMAIGIITVGFQNTLEFATQIIPLSHKWYGAVGNYSIISIFTALFGIRIGLILGTLASFAILAILSIKLINLRKEPDEIKADSILISTFAASLLLSPLAWLNYLIIIWPALLIIIKNVNFLNFRSRWVTILLILIFWNWPEYIEVQYYPLSVGLSSFPTIGLFYILWSTSDLNHLNNSS